MNVNAKLLAIFVLYLIKPKQFQLQIILSTHGIERILRPCLCSPGVQQCGTEVRVLSYHSETFALCLLPGLGASHLTSVEPSLFIIHRGDIGSEQMIPKNLFNFCIPRVSETSLKVTFDFLLWTFLIFSQILLVSSDVYWPFFPSWRPSYLVTVALLTCFHVLFL